MAKPIIYRVSLLFFICFAITLVVVLLSGKFAVRQLSVTPNDYMGTTTVSRYQLEIPDTNSMVIADPVVAEKPVIIDISINDADLIPIQIGSSTLRASVAKTDFELQQGLSNTSFLPDGIVKLFIFGTSERWSFWMLGMNYSLDIIWLDKEKRVVHIENSVESNTFPASFTPTVPARYVIETNAGFVQENGIGLGTQVTF